MNDIDRDIEKAEEAAERHQTAAQAKETAAPPAARSQRSMSIASSASSSSSSSSGSSTGMSRVATQRDVDGTDAERVRTMLSRTRTAQSVYSHTVGARATKTLTKTL